VSRAKKNAGHRARGFSSRTSLGGSNQMPVAVPFLRRDRHKKLQGPACASPCFCFASYLGRVLSQQVTRLLCGYAALRILMPALRGRLRAATWRVSNAFTVVQKLDAAISVIQVAG
jgi:hypothetical protein